MMLMVFSPEEELDDSIPFLSDKPRGVFLLRNKNEQTMSYKHPEKKKNLFFYFI